MVKSAMKIVILILFVLLIRVESKRNGYPDISDGKSSTCRTTVEDSEEDFCVNVCKSIQGRTGNCCLGTCFCFDLPDEQKIVDVMDTTIEYCEWDEEEEEE
uniref:Putative sodium channel toxin Ts26 n=1 Tax=Tityus serrulatus TaxID=6887 RepID=SCX26_TITSE|nr:RecName: Full=Putative sodium channel toxin Ts26; AltName: Full=Putative NaTx; AltName: Full=Tityustoxin-26; Flags: Precursor [Tityus serrulatus]QPD99055.1 putative sodium channel toxin Ts26 [Tityus serrulatus]